MTGTVLLVHDDLATIAAARRVIVSEGLEVVLATSAADAIISFGQRPLAAVVLAPAVDGNRGHSVYDEIRQLPGGGHVRFVLLGAEIADAQGARLVDLPLDAEELRAALRAVLAAEGGGWELAHPAAVPQEDLPAELDSPDPWRVAGGATAVPKLPEPSALTEELFGDVPAAEAAGPALGAAEPIADLAPATEARTDEVEWAKLAAVERQEAERGAREEAERRADEEIARARQAAAQREAEERALRELQAQQQARETAAQLAALEQARAEAEARLEAERAAREQAERRALEAAERLEGLHRAREASEEAQSRAAAQVAAQAVVASKPRAVRPLAAGRWRKDGLTMAAAPRAADAGLPAPGEGPLLPRGELAELGPARFFARCWKERIGGRFDFACRDGSRSLFFEEGRLAAALSSAPSDRLEALAQRDGLITRAQARALRADAAGLSARQLAVRLVELKLIKSAELYALVRRHVELVAYALFTDETAVYAFSSEPIPPELRVALPVHPLAFMLEGVRRKGDFERLDRALGGPSALVGLVEGGPDPDELGLAARERQLLALVDGLRTVEELVFASGVDPASAVKLLHGLEAAGAVEVRAGEGREAGTTEAPGDLLIDLGRVTEKYEQVRNGDYFEILGLPREATSYEVRQAFERLTRELHPSRFVPVGDPGLQARLEEIGRALAEAADVLADDHTRVAYARSLSDSLERSEA